MDPVVIGAGAITALGLVWGGLGTLDQQRGGSRTRELAAPGRPGWVARKRARGGVSHTRRHVGIGYQSAFTAVRLPVDLLNHNGYVTGAPGSGKTTVLRTLIQGYPGPVIALDAKGSPDLAHTFWEIGGNVWTMGGPLKLDLLPSEPSEVAQQLLEGEIYAGGGEVYRAIAASVVEQAASVLRWRGEPYELQRIRELIASPDALGKAIKGNMPADPEERRKAEQWRRELSQATTTTREGMQTFALRLATLLDAPVARSLGAGRDAVTLSDVLARSGKLLVSLSPRYGAQSRKIGAWVLVAMLRLADELRTARWRGRCLFVVDEPRVLQSEGHWLADLFGTARDAGIGLIVADQGITGLSRVHRDLPDAVLRSTAWQLVMRQGSAVDAEKMAALFGQTRRSDVAESSNGTTTTRWKDEPRVFPTWLLDLSVGEGWLRIAPVEPGARLWYGRVATALPHELPATGRVLALPAPVEHPTEPEEQSYPSHQWGQDRASAAEPVGSEASSERAAVLALVSESDANGCQDWQGKLDKDGYPIIKWEGSEIGRKPGVNWVPVHRLLYRWQHGPIPEGYEVDHTCWRRKCLASPHLEALTKAEHRKRTAERRRLLKRQAATVEHSQATRSRRSEGHTAGASPSAATAPPFVIALFEAIGKPAVQTRTVSLEDLVAMLSRFTVLQDKRQGRCWSPTKYVDGASSRRNDGVESVSCLVFDCDRVPPNEERLQGVYWIGHTTWSHTPQSPRWRVVIPLARPVPVKQWADVWRRARAALCPEADPACKDASRAYWLPSHNGGVTAKSEHHAGPLLDPATLPELPAEPMRPVSRAVRIRAGDGQRAEAYKATVIENLEKAAPGGRNAALNHAAWTLGRWVAAGSLDQTDVEDGLYAAAERNGLVTDDGQRQCWATIRSGLSAGLEEPIDPDHTKRSPRRTSS